MRNYLKIILSIVSPFMVIGFIYSGGFPDSKKIFMNGELSVRHSFLETDCTSCHIPWNGVNNESCTKCHNDDKHYVENEPEDTNEPVKQSPRCFDCHQEHKGRSHDLNVTEI